MFRKPGTAYMTNQPQEQERAAIEDHLESWCNNLLGKSFEVHKLARYLISKSVTDRNRTL